MERTHSVSSCAILPRGYHLHATRHRRWRVDESFTDINGCATPGVVGNFFAHELYELIIDCGTSHGSGRLTLQIWSNGVFHRLCRWFRWPCVGIIFCRAVFQGIYPIVLIRRSLVLRPFYLSTLSHIWHYGFFFKTNMLK